MYILHPDAKEIMVEYGVELVKVLCVLPGDPPYRQGPWMDDIARLAINDAKGCVGFWINVDVLKSRIANPDDRKALDQLSLEDIAVIAYGVSLRQGVAEDDLEAYELIKKIASLPVAHEKNRRHLTLLR